MWLLRLTGDHKRNAVVGSSWNNSKGTRPYSSLTIPACDRCNQAHARLETDAKSAVERLLKRESLQAREMASLLDWFDKVRTGYWLVQIALGVNPFGTDPHFGITARVASKDRILGIFEGDRRECAVRALGADTPVFHCMPSCFVLQINEFFFASISREFLLSEALGLPAPTTATSSADADCSDDLRAQEDRDRYSSGWSLLPFNRPVVCSANHSRVRIGTE